MNKLPEETKSVNSKRKPTLWEASIPIIAMVILLSGGYGVLQLPVEILLIIASFIA